MNKHRQGYIDNCPLRTDFLEILSAVLPIDYAQHTARETEKFMVDIKSGYDSLDLKFNYIYYPLPYVKEIFINDWQGGWGWEQSYLHLEYWDGKWRVKKSIKNNGERLESNYNLEGVDIMMEVIQYFNDIDCPVLSGKMLRNYNLSRLV